MPDTLRQALDLRLSHLGAQAQHVLVSAAIVGERFPFTLLARVSGLEEQAMLQSLEEAEGLGILQASGADDYGFTHALLRKAVLSDLPGLRRREWHRQIAAALLASGQPDPELVSLHLSRANDPRAVDYILQAGNRALK